jgi:hypothetical protein
MNDGFGGLDRTNWATIKGAYGPAVVVPGLIRTLLVADATDRQAALHELSATVWHQGTVYECTPAAVPFLATIVCNIEADSSTRAGVALLLANIACATSFVLPDDPRAMRSAAWLRETGDEVATRDLVAESRAAVAATSEELIATLPQAPGAVQAALVAVLIAAPSYNSGATVAVLDRFTDDADDRLATAARIGGWLTEHSVTEQGLATAARIDAEANDYLRDIAGWPLEVRAVMFVLAVIERLVSERLDSAPEERR